MQTTAAAWVATVSARLQRQWPTVDPTRLDDVANDLWRDLELRQLDPERAANKWLRPVRMEPASDLPNAPYITP